jgi:Fe/S biogenesis protein NfuA
LPVESPVLQLDDAARRKLAEMRDAGRFDGSALRVSVREHGASFRYALEVVDTGSRAEGDVVVEAAGILFYVDPASAPSLRGATLQYVEGLSGAGFRFENPNRPRLLLEVPLAGRIQRILDDEINPGIAAHGGRVTLLDVQEGRVVVEFGGGCQGCGMADLTLREGVTATLRRALPEITEVVDATDHDAGESPYYSR